MVHRNPSLRLAVLISGTGRTLRNLLATIGAGQLDAQVVHVVSSQRDAPGLRYAEQARIGVTIAERRPFPDPDAFSRAVFDPCRAASADIVAMAGFLKHVLIPPDFEHRVVNIHPALIPAFCGKGLYGLRVHAAVLDFGVKVSGCTVHFVDNEYDHGPVILQRVVTVAEDDTPQTLADRVFEAECEAYPEALRLLAAGRIHVEGRRVRIAPKSALG
jgi:phosphoribosylglycinamide formyltransferase-1